MRFLVGFLMGIVVYGLWRRLVNRFKRGEHRHEAIRLADAWVDADMARIDAEIGYFSVLCRELANGLIRRHPDRFVDLTAEIVREVRNIQELSKEEASVRLDAMSQTYHEHGAFDGVGTKSYVLYEDGLAPIGNVEIEKHYHDIQIWCALKSVVDDAWRFTSECVSTESRLDEIQKYVSQYKDTILMWQLKSAKRDYDLHERILSQSDEGTSLFPNFYKNEDFEVHFLGDHGPNGTPELAWSVKVLATGDVGCWSVFYGDDKAYIRYYVAQSVVRLPGKWRELNHLPITEPRFSQFLSEP